MNRRAILKSLAASLAFVMGVAAAGGDELPDVTEEGLHRVEDSKLALVYARPGADLSPYSRILLTEAYVAFEKHWERQNLHGFSGGGATLSASEMKKIKAEVAVAFRQVFADTLREGGYELTEEAGEDVLIVKPAVINLIVDPPSSRADRRVSSYAESAGEMTLYVELHDGSSGELLAKAMDLQKGRNSVYFQWQTETMNRSGAMAILEQWAGTLKSALDEAREVRGAGAEDETRDESG